MSLQNLSRPDRATVLTQVDAIFTRLDEHGSSTGAKLFSRLVNEKNQDSQIQFENWLVGETGKDQLEAVCLSCCGSLYPDVVSDIELLDQVGRQSRSHQ